MRILFTLLITFVLTASAYPQKSTISARDLDRLVGSWNGTLTYVDYSSGKRTEIPSQLKITKSVPGEWLVEYIYPLEPKANSKSTIKLSSDGRYLDSEELTDIARSRSGELSFVAIKKGTDNGRDATFRRVYSLRNNSLSIRKEVRIEGTDNFFERNTYAWNRTE